MPEVNKAERKCYSQRDLEKEASSKTEESLVTALTDCYLFKWAREAHL